MSPSVHILLSAEMLVRICEGRGGLSHCLCNPEKFSGGGVNGGSKRGDYEFVCVSTKMCAVLFFEHLFHWGPVEWADVGIPGLSQILPESILKFEG